MRVTQARWLCPSVPGGGVPTNVTARRGARNVFSWAHQSSKTLEVRVTNPRMHEMCAYVDAKRTVSDFVNACGKQRGSRGFRPLHLFVRLSMTSAGAEPSVVELRANSGNDARLRALY